MGFIKEPEGVDFVVNSTPLTPEREKELSLFIARRKLELKRKSNKTLAKIVLSHRTSQR